MNYLIYDSKTKNNKSITWLSILIAIYYLLDLYLRTTSNNLLFFIWLTIGYVGFSFIIFRKNIKVKYIFLLFFILLSMLFSSIFTHNIELLGIFFNIQYLGISFILYEFKLDVKPIIFLIYFYIIFFLYQIFIGVDPNNLFLSSRNEISTVLLNVIVIYYITKYKNNDTINTLPLLFAFIISIWSVSRSAIVSMVMLVIGLVIYKLFNDKIFLKNKYNKKKIIIIFLKIIVLLFFIFIIVYIPTNFNVDHMLIGNLRNNYQKLINRIKYESFISSSRIRIIYSYMNEVSKSFKNLFFGVNMSDTKVFSSYSNNLHNSFLTAHTYYGLLGFLGLLLMIGNTFKNYYKQKKWLYIILLTTVLFRASIDIIAFPGYLDSVIYFFILDGMQFKRIHLKK